RSRILESRAAAGSKTSHCDANSSHLKIDIATSKEEIMKAVVFHGVGDIRLDEVPEPKIEKPNDAIVRLTANAICGTDLHLVRGTLAGMKPGTILGHEGVRIVEEVGWAARNFRPGDRLGLRVAQARWN